MSWLPASPVLRWTLLGLLILVVVGGIAGAGWAWYSAQEARARAALADAAELIQRALAPDGSAGSRELAVKALEVVMAEHSGASIFPQAAYQLGNLHYAGGQYAKARGAFEVALANGATGTVQGLSALGIAYTWEAEKNYPKAQAALEAVLNGRGSKDFLFEEALMDLARVQEFGGNRTAAVATYQRLLKEVPESRRADDVRSRIARLESPAPR